MIVWNEKLQAFVYAKEKVEKNGSASKIHTKKDLPNVDGVVESKPTDEVDGRISQRAGQDD